jgi:exopolysaccharide biosynthesis WecB/TagA/CpsF family protein
MEPTHNPSGATDAGRGTPVADRTAVSAAPATHGAAVPVPRRPGPAVRGKRNVLGVLVDVLDYHEATERLVTAARERRGLAMTALAVHGVMTGVRDPAHQARLNALDVVAPDGQPVRWALNLLHRAELRDWVSGPDLVPRVLARMAAERLPVYLYGGTPETVTRLAAALPRRVPGLRISGAEPSRFRPAGPGEEAAIAARVRRSGARLLLVGLGCPRQEVFAYAMRPRLDLPVLAVGAAFDYHAGRLRRPPRWLRRHGLAWLWRLAQDPVRLWRRYLLLNPEYLVRLAAQWTGLWRPRPAAPARRRPPSVPI